MNAKEVLLNQLDALEDSHWFVSLKESLVGLTDDQAAWKETPESNSIREITNHLIYWNELYLKRFQSPESQGGNNVENDETFRDQEELDWKQTMDKLNHLTAQWIKAVEEADEARFDENAYSHREEAWGSVIANMTIHVAYHTGQILYARKKQGSWNPESGVH
ncbi:DinB family protein [Fictibacillus fluitans]|uniref:DinB family protein n=1 Tax=Fictibacillus fluitans TaxID=3058422 RepID=A0ABT8HWK5_9BACL|nr:DinB family protein [Fictibacillus sp. NE201]MDN4525161.1 DinB family protein [Fictibacillus sp. NE201]